MTHGPKVLEHYRIIGEKSTTARPAQGTNRQTNRLRHRTGREEAAHGISVAMQNGTALESRDDAGATDKRGRLNKSNSTMASHSLQSLCHQPTDKQHQGKDNLE